MAGHIQLNGWWYIAPDPRMIVRSLANPMAAKLGSGAGTYDDLQDYDALLLENYQAGVGQEEVDTEGFFYAEAETRFKNTLCFPPLLSWATHDNDYALADISQWHPIGKFVRLRGTQTLSEVTVGQDYPRFAALVVAQATATINHIYLYLKNEGKTIQVDLVNNSSNLPGATTHATTTVTTSTRPGADWYRVPLAATLSSGTSYWVVVRRITGQFQLLLGDITTTLTARDTYAFHNGTSWAGMASYPTGNKQQAGFFVIFPTSIYGTAWTGEMLVSDFPSVETDNLFCAISNASKKIWISNGPNSDLPADSDDIANTALNVINIGDRLYIAEGSANNLEYATVSGGTPTVTTVAGVEASLFAKWRGYLWRAKTNLVYYTADLSTWSPAGGIQVAQSGFDVNGMAGLAGIDMAVSTDETLLRIVSGDVANGVTEWSSYGATLGKGMVHWQGKVYIPLEKGIVSVDADNALLPVGMDVNEGLPEGMLGNVVALAATNNWLLAAVNPSDEDMAASIWAYNNRGWHFITKLPPALSVSNLAYSRRFQQVYIGLDEGYVMRFPFPDRASLAENVETMPFAWLETNWFYGNLKEVLKDFESVYIASEDLEEEGFTRSIRVYWQDDDSTDWEYLGEVTTNRQELRWSDYATRPTSRGIKLGLLLQNFYAQSTPFKVKAVRIKYLAKVTDRFRWQVPIVVSNNLVLPDGDVDERTTNQIVNELDTLVRQVPPVIYRDVDNNEYEVNVLAASRDIDQWQYNHAEEEANISYIYRLTLEQVTEEVYGGA